MIVKEAISTTKLVEKKKFGAIFYSCSNFMDYKEFYMEQLCSEHFLDFVSHSSAGGVWDVLCLSSPTSHFSQTFIHLVRVRGEFNPIYVACEEWRVNFVSHVKLHVDSLLPLIAGESRLVLQELSVNSIPSLFCESSSIIKLIVENDDDENTGIGSFLAAAKKKIARKLESHFT